MNIKDDFWMANDNVFLVDTEKYQKSTSMNFGSNMTVDSGVIDNITVSNQHSIGNITFGPGGCVNDFKFVPTNPKKHSHYFKDVSKLTTIDIYRVLELYQVTNQALGHAIKKLLVAGGRGAGKSIEKDIQEAIDTLIRYQEIEKENAK